MSEPGSGQIVSSHLLKLMLGVVSLIAFAMVACNGSGDGSVSPPTAPQLDATPVPASGGILTFKDDLLGHTYRTQSAGSGKRLCGG